MVQCYYRNDQNPNLIRSINSGVCMGSGSAAGFFSCCFPWDQCLPNGMCHANSSQTYYTSLCTDQTLQDDACQKGCDGRYRTGVTYDASSKLWACCDKSDASCSIRTNLTINLPAPELLLAQTMTIVDFLPTSTKSPSTATISQASSLDSATANISQSRLPASPTSQMSVSHDAAVTISSAPTARSSTAVSASATSTSSVRSSSLSPGAIAGISVAVAIFLSTLIAAALIWKVHKKRQSADQVQEMPADLAYLRTEMPTSHHSVTKGAQIHEAPQRAIWEKPG